MGRWANKWSGKKLNQNEEEKTNKKWTTTTKATQKKVERCNLKGERGGGRVASVAQDCWGAKGEDAGDDDNDGDENGDDDDDKVLTMIMTLIFKVKGLVESEEERQAGSAKATPVKKQKNKKHAPQKYFLVSFSDKKKTRWSRMATVASRPTARTWMSPCRDHTGGHFFLSDVDKFVFFVVLY